MNQPVTNQQTPHAQYGYPMQAPAQFPNQLQVPVPSGSPIPSMPGGQFPVQPAPTQGMLPMEQSYVENILRFNRGKIANVYMTFEYSPEWPSRVFRGVIEEAGRDHLILSDPDSGKSYLLLMVNLDFVEFDEPIAYVPQVFPGTAPSR